MPFEIYDFLYKLVRHESNVQMIKAHTKVYYIQIVTLLKM